MNLIYLANARIPTPKAYGLQICRMCASFARQGARVTLVCPARKQPLELSKSAHAYYGVETNFAVEYLPCPDLFRFENFLPPLLFTSLFTFYSFIWAGYAAWAVARQGADVYYTRDPACAWWLCRLGLPLVYEAHSIPHRLQKGFVKSIGKSPHLKLTVPLTDGLASELKALGFDRRSILIAPDGVDLSLFQGLPSPKQCRQELGLPLDQSIVGYVGRFQTMGQEKGIPDLIKALSGLPESGSSAPVLCCVGGPFDNVPYYRDLANRVGVHPQRLICHDRVAPNQVPYWIRACDVVTIPWHWTTHSAYYTSPMKMFEYMAAGVPIVASDLPSLREVLRHDQNAWLTPPGNPQALADGIRTLLEDRARADRIALQASRDVRSYTWDARAHTIMDRLTVSAGKAADEY